MARHNIVQYSDDFDGTPLNEDEVRVIRFSVDGTDYLLDVSESNAGRFYEAIAPFIAKAHTQPVDVMASISASEIRLWAKEQGYEVASRGKIPAELIEDYRAAHSM